VVEFNQSDAIPLRRRELHPPPNDGQKSRVCRRVRKPTQAGSYPSLGRNSVCVLPRENNTLKQVHSKVLANPIHRSH